jgi:uncharacterized protein (TIGR02246 family)
MVAAGSFREVVEEFHQEFMEAVKRGDAASIAAGFTEDGTLLPPNMETVRGRKGIEALLGMAMGTMGLREATLRTVSIEEDGDVAFEIGELTMTYQPQGGPARTDQGKYVLLWKRQADGTWMLRSEMWNSNSPPPAM